MNFANEVEQATDAIAPEQGEAASSAGLKMLVASVAALAIGLVAGTQALGQISNAQLPAISKYWQGPSASMFEIGQADASGTPVAPEAREQAALTALEGSPLYPQGLAHVGLAWQAEGRPKASVTNVMRLADRLSRREAISQSWLAEHYLRGNKPDQAMYHIDMMLRANPQIGQPVLTGLSQVIRFPDARRALARLINGGTPWADTFLDFALSGNKPARPVGQLLLLVDPKFTGSRRMEFKGRIVRRLAEDRDFDVLYALYPRLVTDTRAPNPWAFDRLVGLPPSAWSLAGDARFGGAVERNRTGVGLRLQGWVMPGTRAVVMHKLFSVPAQGEWQIVSRRLNSPPAPEAYANWRVSCATAGPSAPYRESVNLLEGPVLAALPLNGMGCRLFMLELVMSGGEAADSAQLNLTEVGLAPLGAASTPALEVTEAEVMP